MLILVSGTVSLAVSTTSYFTQFLLSFFVRDSATVLPSLSINRIISGPVFDSGVRAKTEKLYFSPDLTGMPSKPSFISAVPFLSTCNTA